MTFMVLYAHSSPMRCNISIVPLCIHLFLPPRYFSRRLTLLLCSLIVSVLASYSNPFLRITCTKKFACLLLMLQYSKLVDLNHFKTISYVVYFLYNLVSIWLKNRILNALVIVSAVLLVVRVSLPYMIIVLLPNISTV